VIGGVPFVSWIENEGSGSESIRVARLNAAGDGWDHVGSPIAIGTLNSQAIGSVNGVPFVAWQVLAAPQPAPTDWLLRVSRLEPEFLSASATPTSTGATLSVRVRTYGVSYPVGFQFGAGLTSTTATVKTSGDIATVTEKLSGLAAKTVYPYRPFAIAGTPAPVVLGPQQSFTTLAPDTQPPSAPRPLRAKFSRGTLSLTWQPSTDNVGVGPLSARPGREGGHPDHRRRHPVLGSQLPGAAADSLCAGRVRRGRERERRLEPAHGHPARSTGGGAARDSSLGAAALRLADDRQARQAAGDPKEAADLVCPLAGLAARPLHNHELISPELEGSTVFRSV
jgi:hypothetical protein